MLPALGKEDRNYGCDAQDHSPSREPVFQKKMSSCCNCPHDFLVVY